MADVLYQQDPGGKVSSGFGPHDEEIAPLFPSSHGLCVNRAPFTVMIKELWFHGKDSKMGNET